MVRQTVERLGGMFPPERIHVVCGKEHKEATARELHFVPPENIIDEPFGRDTAAAIGLFAVFLEWREPGAIFAAMPADQYIGDVAAFHAALEKAAAMAEGGALVTFGVKPTRPATGFGYLEVEGDKVVRYCEKPDLARAKEFVSSGRHLWNSGIFVWKSSSILGEIERQMPPHFAGLKKIQAALGTSAFPQVLFHEYGLMAKTSIDYGVMEKAREVRVVRAEFAWDDVGSWTAAAAHRPKDGEGNAIEALAAMVDTKECIIVSSDNAHVIGTIGLRDVVIVHTKDATLVCAKERAEEIRKLVEQIGKQGLDRVL